MENLQQNQKGQGKAGIFVAGDDNLQILSIKKIKKSESSKIMKHFQINTCGSRKGCKEGLPVAALQLHALAWIYLLSASCLLCVLPVTCYL